MKHEDSSSYQKPSDIEESKGGLDKKLSFGLSGKNSFWTYKLTKKKALKLGMMIFLNKVLNMIENSKECIISALVYLDKLNESGVILNPTSIQK